MLFAAGRTPNTEGLGLEEVGVQLDARGRIVVDRYFRTTAPGIYAAGDVVGPALASTAMQQGRAAACHAFGLVFGVAVDRAASSAVYGVPEVAGVGLTEEQARRGEHPLRRRPLRPGGDRARRHRRARRAPEADLPRRRPHAARRPLHRRHRLGDRRPRPRRPARRRRRRAVPHAGAQHADLQRGLPRRRHRRADAAGSVDGPAHPGRRRGRRGGGAGKWIVGRRNLTQGWGMA